MDKQWSQIAISIIAVAAIVVALVLGVEIQAGLVALVVLAVLPWLAAVVESIDLPGAAACGSARCAKRSNAKASS